MNQFRFYVVRTYLILRYYFHRLTGTGCFGAGQAQSFAPPPGLAKGAQLQAGLLRHHVKQYHESSCSVATVVNVVNALREKFKIPGPLVTQQAILDTVRTAHWKERMGPNGYKGRRGLPIGVLGDVVRDSLLAYDIPFHRVEVIQGVGKKNKTQAKRKILQHIKAFQSNNSCLIIAHFDQGCFIQELNIPHISPVGGFDPVTGTVTILDVDPDQVLPYRIPFSTFYKGISSRYAGVFRPFGYDRGGIVVIHLTDT